MRIVRRIPWIFYTIREFARSLLVLIRLKKSIFINSIRDVSFVGKAGAVALIIFVSLYSGLWGSGLFIGLKSIARNDPSFLLPLVNAAVFVVFVWNILAVVLIGGSRILLLDKLIYYPIDPRKGVALEVVAGTVQPINLIFVAVYIAACLVPQNPLTVTTIVATLLLAVLFIILVSNLSLLIRITVAVTVTFRQMRRLLTVVMVGAIFFALASIRFFSHYITAKQHILDVSSILSYLPSGAWVNALFGLGTSRAFRYVSWTVVYLLWANFVVLWLSARMIPVLKKRIFAASGVEAGRNRRSILSWVWQLGTEPLAKKNIIYALRSSRNIARLPIFLCCWLLFPAYLIAEKHPVEFNANGEGVLLLMIFFVHSAAVISQCGSAFSNDYGGIVNYFFRPVSAAAALNSKKAVAKSLGIFGAFMFLIVTILFKDSLISALILCGMFLLGELLFIEVGVYLSIYFIKPDPFRLSMAIGYVDRSAFSLLISLPLIVAFAVAMMLLMRLTWGPVASTALLSLIILLNFLFYRFEKYLDGVIGDVLLNRKEKVIAKCL